MKKLKFKAEFTFTGEVEVMIDKRESIDYARQQLENNFGFIADNISGGAWLSNDKEEEGIIDWNISMHPEETSFILENSQEEKYILKEDGIQIMRSHFVKINEIIFREELFEYQIIDRENFIDELYRWIAECKTSDKQLMKDDLQMLLTVKDDYIFSSGNTNDYIYNGCSNFNETCENLIKLSEEILVEIEQFKKNWGQTHSEICSCLGYDEDDSDDVLMGDNYFWHDDSQLWLNKEASGFTEREQKIADYLKSNA